MTTIQPLHQSALISPTVLFSLIFAIFGFILVIFAQKNRTIATPRRHLLQMLGGFVGVIALCTAVLQWATNKRLIPVEIKSDSITTSFGTAMFRDIEEVKMFPNVQMTALTNSPKDTVFQMLIIEQNGKTHVLSEQDYPIQTISEALTKVLK